MVWSTKSLGRTRDYVLVKHRLRNINCMINGVRFRCGYAVVEKNSKTYKKLKQLPLIKGQPEFPLTFLRKLPFITRSSDVRMVYGQDVYRHYHTALMKELEKEKQVKKVEQEVVHVTEDEKCKHRTKIGDLCKRDALEVSPGGYCKLHLLNDPKLSEFGFVWPSKLTRDQKKEQKDKIITRLTKLKKK